MNTPMDVHIPPPEQVVEFWQAFMTKQRDWSGLEETAWVETANEWLGSKWSGIAFELCKNDGEGVDLLVMTAHGAVDQFALVSALTTHAPALPGYRLEAFRQRSESANFTMRMQSFELSPSDVLVHHYAAGGQVGLEIGFAKPVSEEMMEHAKNMSFIMLDHIVGEYDFAVKIGPVDFVDELAESCVGLDQFAPVFDAFWMKELGHTQVFPEAEQECYRMLEFRTTDQDTGEERGGMITVNDSANAVAMRADLAHALTVKLPARSKAELDLVYTLQDRVEHLLRLDQSGIFACAVFQDGWRELRFYVSVPAKAATQVQQQIEQLRISEHELGVQTDYTWDAYYEFYLAGGSED